MSQEDYLKAIGVDAPFAGHLAQQAKPPSAPRDREARLAELAREAAGCTRCALAQTRTQVVFGVGDPSASLVIIGEAPGKDEDRLGEPFVGRAGKLLDKMLAAIGLSRQKGAYIMNVLKCRPPNNRNPLPEEIEACAWWREAQLDLLSPRVYALLGRFAAQTMLHTNEPVSALRGRVHELRGQAAIVSWHPAYLLRQPLQKRTAWEDWQTIARLLRTSMQ